MKPIVPPLSVLGLFVLGLLPGCSSQVSNALKVHDNLEQAAYYAQLDQAPQARQWADRAVAVDPNALSTYLPTGGADEGDLSIAGVFSATGDDPTLRDYMKQAAARFPDDHRPLVYLDEAYGRLGDAADQKATATALAALLEKKIAAPGNARDEDMMLALAQAYCDAGNLAKGAADYQAVITAHPADTDALNGRAYAWAVANSAPDLPQALADIQKAIALVPKQPGLSSDQVEAKMNAYLDTLGWVQHRQGDDKDALTNIQAAIAITPRVAEERYHLGVVYEALHQPDAARAEFTHAALLSHGYAAAQQELSRLNQTAPAPPPAKPAATPPADTAQTARR